MKTGFVIVALSIGLLAGGMTGASLAGGEGSADPEGASSWASQIQGPIETGALSDAMGTASMDRGSTSNDAGFTFVESGGVRYRVGLDTGS